MKTFRFICLSSLIFALTAQGESASITAETANAIMSRRAELIAQKSELQIELERAWLDDAQTSEAVVAARKKYQELQTELERAKSEIQKCVLALPANQEKQQKIAAIDQELAGINQKVESLRRSMRQSGTTLQGTTPVQPSVK